MNDKIFEYYCNTYTSLTPCFDFSGITIAPRDSFSFVFFTPVKIRVNYTPEATEKDSFFYDVNKMLDSIRLAYIDEQDTIIMERDENYFSDNYFYDNFDRFDYRDSCHCGCIINIR